MSQSHALDDGFRTAVLNGHGVVATDVFASGNQERALAGSYAAIAARLIVRWPRAAAIMRGLAARSA